jgi:hypothetical protein
MLLDRFGARRVESALLLVAAAGAATFAVGQSIGDLAIGRGLIGLGVSACLMAAFKAFSLSFRLDRQASLTGWIMTSGGLGALAATAPLEAALQLVGWRDIFFVLAGLTLAVAAGCSPVSRKRRARAAPEPLATQWAGVKAVFASAHFWRFAPRPVPDRRLHGGAEPVVDFVADAGQWLHACAGRRPHGRNERRDAARLRADRPPRHRSRKARDQAGPLLGAGLASRWSRWPDRQRGGYQSYLLWLAYGSFSSFGTLAYSQAAAGFPLALSGRANTAFNLMVFIGAFGVQWGLGLLIDLLQGHGQSAADGAPQRFSRPLRSAVGVADLVLDCRAPATLSPDGRAGSAVERHCVEATLDLGRHLTVVRGRPGCETAFEFGCRQTFGQPGRAMAPGRRRSRAAHRLPAGVGSSPRPVRRSGFRRGRLPDRRTRSRCRLAHPRFPCRGRAHLLPARPPRRRARPRRQSAARCRGARAGSAARVAARPGGVPAASLRASCRRRRPPGRAAQARFAAR